MCTGMMLLISIQEVVVYRIIYMILFLLFMLTFQVKKKIQTGLQPCKFNSPRTRLSIALGPVSRYLLKKNFTMQCKSAIVKLSFVFFLDELHSMEGLNVCVLVGHHHLFYGCPDNTLHISIPRFPKLLAKQHRTLRQNVSLCIKVEQCNNI